MRVPIENPSDLRLDVQPLSHRHVEAWWWRFANGWTRCTPFHEHPSAEAAVACYEAVRLEQKGSAA